MRTVRYGPHPDQVGDLYPSGDASAPLLILLHGGFWRMPYGRGQCDAIARDLQAAGFAIWNVEYRRLGVDGAGWPGTAEDVITALEFLSTADELGAASADGGFALVGHSAGGHLALWAAGEWSRRGPRPGPPLLAAVGLAPLADLVRAADEDLGGGAVTAFLRGTPALVPDRYHAASPMTALPLGVRQLLVHGTDDSAVPIEHSREYARRAHELGDPVDLTEVSGGGHMDHLDPRSASHQALREWLTRDVSRTRAGGPGRSRPRRTQPPGIHSHHPLEPLDMPTPGLPARPSVLQCIGNTSLVALRKVVPPHGARILLKLESENPTGSMKDRMALAMVEAAEADGRLAPGGQVVEYTGGSTGVSLSLVCAAKGYPLDIVSSDAFAQEKLDYMRILGAAVHIVKSDGGGMTEQLTREMVEAARVIAQRPGSFWTNQLNNPDQVAAYHGMAEEIWAQTGGRIDAFVQSVGTAASLRGTAEGLRRHDERVRIVAVEPAESPVLSGGRSGAHKIDGVGAGFVVPLWRKEIVDQIVLVSTDDAAAMALRLAREEGIFGGTSTGANVVAAMRVAATLGAGATVVTIMCDTGMKYLKSYGARLGGR